MSNDDKNKSDFDKLFDELFKDTNKKDDISAKKDDVLDDDILNEFLNMNSDKGDTINHVVDQETNINDDKQPKDTKSDDDNFDWLKDLIDEIDREEQEKKQNTANSSIVSHKPLKPSFTSKLSEKPRPPKPPAHIANWGLGKKTVILPLKNENVIHNEIYVSRKKIHIYYICFILSLIAIGFLNLYSNLQNDKKNLCNSSSVIMRHVYSGDKILVDMKEITDSGLDIVDKGYIDAQISNLMYSLIKPGEKVIDVGAGFGYYTLYLARIVGNAGQVYSFEARKHIFELLDSSVRINRFSNVQTFNKVLFADNTRLLLDTQNHQKRSNFGVANLILEQEQIYSNHEKREVVDGVSLDAILNDVSNISMLHINAHGSELSIILGAQRLIATSPKIKIITSWSKYQMAKYVNINNVVTQLVDNGFRFWLIKPSNGTLIELSKVEHILQVERGRFLIAKTLQ